MKETQPDITLFIGALKHTIKTLQNTDNEASIIWSPLATKLNIVNSVIGSTLPTKLVSITVKHSVNKKVTQRIHRVTQSQKNCVTLCILCVTLCNFFIH